MKNTFLFALILLTGVTCCKKPTAIAPSLKGDYLISGGRGGFVIPTYHATYFLINNGELREDTSEAYASIPDDVSNFKFNYLLPSASYNKVKYLITTVPAELLSKNNQTIGSVIPDLGYTEVRARIGNVVYQWHFEGDQSASSAAVQAYVHRLRTDFY